MSADAWQDQARRVHLVAPRAAPRATTSKLTPSHGGGHHGMLTRAAAGKSGPTKSTTYLAWVFAQKANRCCYKKGVCGGESWTWEYDEVRDYAPSYGFI